MPDVAVGREAAGAVVRATTSDDRERLIDAITRAAAECGYTAVDVEQIAHYAGLSVDDFYRHFANEDQCLVAAYNKYIDRMLAHVGDACEGVTDWTERVKLTIEAALDYVSELGGVSRVFAVDATRLGPAALERTCAWIDWAALQLRHGRALFAVTAGMPDAMERSLVGGLVLSASFYLLTEEPRRLSEFAPEAVEVILTPYVGSARAREIAAG